MHPLYCTLGTQTFSLLTLKMTSNFTCLPNTSPLRLGVWVPYMTLLPFLPFKFMRYHHYYYYHYYYYYFTFCEFSWWFFTGVSATVSLFRSPELFGVFWLISTMLIVSICPQISNSSSPLSNPLETVPSVPITIRITLNLTFHSFLIHCKVQILVSIFCFFDFTMWSVETAKSIIQQFFF